MVRASCLCGSVRFAISGEIIELGNCHCSECRKAYAAAFGTVAVVAKKHFAYEGGEDHIRMYRQSKRVNRKPASAADRRSRWSKHGIR